MKKLIIILLLSLVINEILKCKVNELQDEEKNICIKVCKENEYYNEEIFACDECKEDEIYNPDKKSVKNQIVQKENIITKIQKHVRVYVKKGNFLMQKLMNVKIHVRKVKFIIK